MATGKIQSSITRTASSLTELNSIITGLPNSGKALATLLSTVVNSLIGKSTVCNAVLSKMDDVTADILLYSLGGDYIGAVRYLTSTSSATKTMPIYLNYQEKTVTLGATLYQNYYYADAQFTNVPDNGIVSVVIWGAASNRPAFAVRIGSSKYRIFGPAAETEVTVRAYYR